MNEDVLETGLPKWPALLVVGKPVTPEQAAEILIRTDRCIPDFYYGTNDDEHGARLSQLFGLPNGLEGRHQPDHWDKLEALENRLSVLSLEYLANSQIVSAWVGGPHGWCDWEGRIGCSTFNIGKHPSAEDVLKDWRMIAQAFPFLELECQLCTHEAGYAEKERGDGPCLHFRVSKGEVEIRKEDPLTAPYVVTPRGGGVSGMRDLLNPLTERGISFEKLKDKLLSLYDGKIPQYGQD